MIFFRHFPACDENRGGGGVHQDSVAKSSRISPHLLVLPNRPDREQDYGDRKEWPIYRWLLRITLYDSGSTFRLGI